MTIPSRPRLIVFGIMATAGILVCGFPDQLAAMGLDFWNADRYQSEFLEEEARSARLEVIGKETTHRLTLKSEITEMVIADRMTLAQATEQFAVMNRACEDLTELVRYSFPAPTIDESTALQVIAFVESRLHAYPPSLRHEVLSRLERQQ